MPFSDFKKSKQLPERDGWVKGKEQERKTQVGVSKTWFLTTSVRTRNGNRTRKRKIIGGIETYTWTTTGLFAFRN